MENISGYYKIEGLDNTGTLAEAVSTISEHLAQKGLQRDLHSVCYTKGVFYFSSGVAPDIAQLQKDCMQIDEITEQEFLASFDQSHN